MTAVDRDAAEGDAWFDEAAGPLVRPYAMTGGRTRAGDHGLNIITLVLAVAEPGNLDVGTESGHILALCAGPTSVAEIAATLDLPLAVVKVLVSDLMDRGLVECRSPVVAQRLNTASFLQVVLDGIEKI